MQRFMQSKSGNQLFSMLLVGVISLFALSPAHAGVIVIDFTAEVTNLNEGFLGPTGTVVNGSISFELTDITDLPDTDSRPVRAFFSDGPRFRSIVPNAPPDLVGFGSSLSSDLLFGSSNSDSVFLSLGNRPTGDILFLEASVGNTVFDFTVFGTADLFSGDLQPISTLPELEGILASFDSSQLGQNAFPNTGLRTSRFVSGTFLQDALTLTSVSISAVSVPEPTHFGVFALILFLFCRYAGVRASIEDVEDTNVQRIAAG